MDQVASRTKKRSIGAEIVKTVVSILVLGLGVAVFGWLLMLRQPPPNKDSDALITRVSTVPAEAYDGAIDMVISGTVVPAYEIKLTSEVNGRILTKYPACEAGNYVAEGTKLLEIDPTDLELTLKSNEADLKQSQKMVAETQEDINGATRNIELARNELKLLRSEHERNVRLGERGASSDAEVDQSARAVVSFEAQLTTRQNTLKAAEARLDRMKAAIEVSEARINQTKLALSKTTIVAPTSGVIVQEMIQEGETATPGTHLITFENTEKIEVLCTLTARDLEWIRENKRVDLSTMTEEQRMSAIYRVPKTDVFIYDSKHPDTVWKGTLERVDGIGRDDKTKTIPVRIVIDEPIIDSPTGPKALVRNMFVKCRIEVDVEDTAEGDRPIAFPATGLRPGNFVWIASPDRTLARKKVSVIDHVKDKDTDELLVVIRGGKDTVLPGEAVIVSPLSQGTVGARILLGDEEDDSKEKSEKTEASADDSTSSSEPDAKPPIKSVAEKSPPSNTRVDMPSDEDPKLN